MQEVPTLIPNFDSDRESTHRMRKSINITKNVVRERIHTDVRGGGCPLPAPVYGNR